MELTFGSYAEAAIAMSALASMGSVVKGKPALAVVGAAEKNDVANVSLNLAADTGAKAAGKATEPAADKAAGIPYLTVKTALADFAKDPARRPAAVKALAKFGVKVGTELTPEQYGPFLAELQAAA